MHREQIKTTDELLRHLETERDFRDVVLQSLDVSDTWREVTDRACDGLLLLGCRMPPEAAARFVELGALLFPRLEAFPFDPYRSRLYSPAELLGGYVVGEEASYDRTLDGRIYRHFVETGRAQPTSIFETLARRLHDHAITEALEERLIGARVVAVMGGHAMQRGDDYYMSVARIAAALSRRGFLMTSGGGPGAMEATHVGAWFAHREDALVGDVLPVFSEAPHYHPIGPWLDTAVRVTSRFPEPDARSLGVPTWLYGHEPPTMFATDIAKYFANCVREDGLLAIARHGVVFSPGSAGTIQEVFQDATQNHYETVGVVSPMIFLGRRFWTEERPVLPLLKRLAGGRPYAESIFVTDDVDEAVEAIERHAGAIDRVIEP